MFYHTEEAMASKEKELQKKITELEVWQCFMNSRNSKHVSKHIPGTSFCKKYFDKYFYHKTFNTVRIWPHET